MPTKPSKNCIMPASAARVMKAFQCLLNNDIMVNASMGIVLAPAYNAKTVIALSVVTLAGKIEKGPSIPATENPVATSRFKTVKIFKNVNALISYIL